MSVAGRAAPRIIRLEYIGEGAAEMEQTMSRLLIETVVKRALEDIKESPERGIRNLIDMALQFSEGRFQREFFTSAQAMLQNENSAYTQTPSGSIPSA